MSVVVYLSGHLKNYTGGETEIALGADFSDVEKALDLLWQRHPALRDRILTEQGNIREHVNIFVGTEDVKRQKGLRTAVKTNEIHIFNAVSGG